MELTTTQNPARVGTDIADVEIKTDGENLKIRIAPTEKDAVYTHRSILVDVHIPSGEVKVVRLKLSEKDDDGVYVPNPTKVSTMRMLPDM